MSGAADADTTVPIVSVSVKPSAVTIRRIVICPPLERRERLVSPPGVVCEIRKLRERRPELQPSYGQP